MQEYGSWLGKKKMFEAFFFLTAITMRSKFRNPFVSKLLEIKNQF